MWRRLLVASALALAPFAAGCGVEEKLTVYPDGTGKIELSSTMTGALAKLGAGGPRVSGDVNGEDPLAELGEVYWMPPRDERRPGETKTTLAGYFEDVSKVHPLGKDSSLRLERGLLGETTLEIRPGLAEKIAEGNGARGDDDDGIVAGLARCLFSNLRLRGTVVMPGKVRTAEPPLVASGREASFETTADVLFGLAQRGEHPPELVRVVSESHGQGLRSEIESFREELARAKRDGKKAQRKKAEAGRTEAF